MAKALSDDKIATILARAISNSEHLADGKLAKERMEVDQYLRGELPKPLHKGDSKYVSRDVFDAVDSMRSTVLEAFMAHHRIVFFRPEHGETVDDAKQATEYCRHVFFKENDGENILYDTLTDGLTKRFSCVKVYYKSMSEEDEYDFEGLTDEELTALVSEYENYEFTEANISENGLYNGTFEVKTEKGIVCVESVQPEDLLVSSRTSDLSKAKYVIHRVSKSKSDLLKEGYDPKKVDEITFSGHKDVDMDYEKQLRFEPIDDIISTDDGYDESVEEAVVHECYIRLDMEGRGKNRLWRIIYCNGVILEKEQISRIPFVAFVPLPIPHTFFGENFAKSVIPVQNARTVLIRQIINHTMITNNPRLQVLTGTVQNPNELLENRLGGIVNVRRMDGLAPIPQAPLNPFVFNLIQMIDEDKEEVTGISKLSQGMNKDAISTQNAQGMVEQLISASQQRTKIISRLFGKFLKDLWHLIYHTAVDYIEEAEYVEVTGSYVEVQPKMWKERKAASIELTLGYGEQEMEAQKWTEIDMYFSQDPTLSAGYDYARRYEVVTRALEKRGIEDIQSLLTPPDQMKPPEPSEAEQLQMEQMRSQIEYQKAQAKAMLMKAETDQMKAQADLIKARADAGLKTTQAQLAPLEFEHEQWVDRTEMELAKRVPESGQRAVLNPN
jgi:hypothetical protein